MGKKLPECIPTAFGENVRYAPSGEKRAFLGGKTDFLLPLSLLSSFPPPRSFSSLPSPLTVFPFGSALVVIKKYEGEEESGQESNQHWAQWSTRDFFCTAFNLSGHS